MKKYKKVLVAVSNDKFKHTLGVWDSVGQCARDLDIPEMTIYSALRRKAVVKKIDAYFEWMVIEE